MGLLFTVKKFRIWTLFLFLMLLLAAPLVASSEHNDYIKIIESAYSDDYGRISWLCRSFYSKYPKSRLIPEIRIIESRTLRDSNAMIKSLKDIIKKYPTFKDNDQCQLKICEILYLSARWSELDREATIAISVYGKRNRFYPFFIHYRSKAAFYTHNYEAGIGFADNAFEADKNFVFYPELRLQNIFSEQKIHYDGDRYVSQLLESYYELEGSGTEVSSLYLLARNSELKNQHSLAYSIYTDLIKRYPRSPEALMAANRISIMKDFKPRYIKNPLAKLDKQKPNIIDQLSPDTPVEKAKFKSYYALSIGPFYNLQEAEKLMKQLKRDFDSVFIIRGYNTFSIYVGQSESSENAMHYKIRLAEEFGINGDIVYIASEENLRFIHKE